MRSRPGAARGIGRPAAEATDVWLGDVIRAWRVLNVNDNAAREVAGLLGFSLPTPPTPGGAARDAGHASSPSPARTVPARAARQASPEPADTRPVPAPAPLADRPPAQSMPFRRHLRPAGVDVGLRTRVTGDGGGPSGLVPQQPTRVTAALPLLPLLSGRVAPGLLTAAISTDAGDGPPDVDALVELVAQRRFGEVIPRAVRASLFRGVQVLLDRSPAMAPFARDVTELARLIRAVVGQGVQEVSFTDSADQTVPHGAAPYSPPPAGTPVLVLSDLGIGQPPGYLRADADIAWRPLAATLHRRDSPLVALIPYPRSRWPALGDCLRMIPWDTTTSPTDVTGAIGRVLGGPRGRR